MSRARGLLAASHPLPSAAVTAFATALGLAAGLGAHAALVAAAVLAGQLSVGWCNDWADRRVDGVAGRAEKPLVRGTVTDSAVLTAALLALAATAPLSLAVGWRAGVAHLVAVGAAWAYNLHMKSTSLSPLPFAVAFALVPPCFVAWALPRHPQPRPALVAVSALLGVAAHFANTLKDVAADARTAVRGLPQRLGPQRSRAVAAGLLLLAAVLLFATPAAPGLVPALAVGVALCYGTALWWGLADRHAFRFTVATVGCLVTAFLLSGAGLVAR